MSKGIQLAVVELRLAPRSSQTKTWALLTKLVCDVVKIKSVKNPRDFTYGSSLILCKLMGVVQTFVNTVDHKNDS